MQGKQLNRHKNLALRRKFMYKFERYRQLGLADFNQPVGLKMNLENRWVKKAETIPRDTIEEKYAKLFPGKTGMPAKPLRMAFGSLLIQKQLGFSDRELVEEIEYSCNSKSRIWKFGNRSSGTRKSPFCA